MIGASDIRGGLTSSTWRFADQLWPISRLYCISIFDMNNSVINVIFEYIESKVKICMKYSILYSVFFLYIIDHKNRSKLLIPIKTII